VVGHVHDLADLGNRVRDGDLDPLGQSHASHGTTLTPAPEAQKRRRVLDRDQFRPAPVGRDRWIYLVLDYLGHPLGDISGEIRGGRVYSRRRGRAAIGPAKEAVLTDHRARGSALRWLVRVVENPSLELRVVAQVDGGALNRLERCPGDHQGEVIVSLDDVARRGLIDVHEVQVVEVLIPVVAIDLEPQREVLGILLPRARLQDRLARSWGDGYYGLGHRLAPALCRLVDFGRRVAVFDAAWAIIGPMRRVVLLIPSVTYRATDFVSAAAALDLDLVVASDRRSALQAVMGDRAQVVRLDRPHEAADRLVELNARLPFDAVLGVDDQGVLAASVVAERLGLPHASAAAVAATRDKHALRQRLSAAGMAQPLYALTSDDRSVAAAVDELRTPCVLKPLHLSASRGVIRADSVPEALDAARRIRDLAGSEEVLVETYVEGVEVAVEALVSGGEADVLAIFDKPDPLEGPYFEETIYVTPSRMAAGTQKRIVDELGRAVDALDLNEGPVHAEFRVDGTNLVTLELAARSIGGLCSRALRFGAGVSLEELILRHALGLGVDERRLSERASGVMMIPIPARGTLVRVGNVETARAVVGIEGLEITIPRGQKVVPLPEGDRYLGFLFAAGDHPAQVENALRRAHALLDIDIRTG